jgi:hypothetical protein
MENTQSVTSVQYNKWAVISLVLSIGGLFLWGSILPTTGAIPVFVGSIMGYIASKQIKRTGEKGMGIAKASQVIGIIAAVLLIVSAFLLYFLASKSV